LRSKKKELEVAQGEVWVKRLKNRGKGAILRGGYCKEPKIRGLFDIPPKGGLERERHHKAPHLIPALSHTTHSPPNINKKKPKEFSQKKKKKK